MSVRVWFVCSRQLLHTSVMLLHVLALLFSSCFSLSRQAAAIIHCLELGKPFTDSEAVCQLHDYIWRVSESRALLALEHCKHLLKGQIQDGVLTKPEQS